MASPAEGGIAGALPCGPLALYVQEPTGPDDPSWTAGFSDVASAVFRYEQIGPATGASMSISSIRVWGVDAEPPGYECVEDPQFAIVNFYHDNGGVPGALHISLGTIDIGRVVEGVVSSHGYSVNSYTFAVPDIGYLDNEWLSIQAGSDVDDCVFAWLNSPDGDGLSYLEELYDPGNFGAQPFDLSICVEGAPVTCPEDLNGDGQVNTADLLSFLAGWGPCIPSMSTETLHPADCATGDRFGHAVAGHGDMFVAGAAYADPFDLGEAGAAYVYEWNGTAWEEGRKLTAPDPAPDDEFGFSLDVTEDLMLVGARRKDTYRGAAYVFYWDGNEWTEWQWPAAEEGKLVAPDGATWDQYGRAVAADDQGRWLVVAAPFRDDGATDTGAAYIYRQDWDQQWILDEKLVGDAGSAFGFGVGIDGNTAIIGAPLVNGSSGRVHLYEATWDDVEWIWAPVFSTVGSVDSDLGFSVSIDGNLALAGAPAREKGEPGSVFRFAYNDVLTEWTLLDWFFAPDASIDDEFGYSVDLGEDWAVVGARGSGAAYVYRREGSELIFDRKLETAAAGDDFGFSAAVADAAAVVGARLNGEVGTEAGAVYAETVCSPDFTGDGAVSSTDLLQLLAAWGTCPP